MLNMLKLLGQKEDNCSKELEIVIELSIHWISIIKGITGPKLIVNSYIKVRV